jgi:predicted nuclease of predicted toxin-antitoxin system
MAAMKFLADESFDFAVVRELRSGGHDVVCVSETVPGTPDLNVLRMARDEQRILLTEDKDFGDWVFSHGETIAGVVLLRFPSTARAMICKDMSVLVREHGLELSGSFTVLEPGRARIRKTK